MQEHPEKYSDEQIEAMMDKLDQMPDVETAWQKFTESSSMESGASQLRKVAAAVIGIVMAGGIALAAIHLARSVSSAFSPAASP